MPETGNNGHLLSDNSAPSQTGILNSRGGAGRYAGMKRRLLSLLVATALFTQAAAAACYADYKAKQDNPLRLHYGVAELRGACDTSSARTELSSRLDRAGWTLLNVMSVFGPDGLDKRKDSAGTYYLRF